MLDMVLGEAHVQDLSDYRGDRLWSLYCGCRWSRLHFFSLDNKCSSNYYNRNSILTTKQVVAIINNNCARFFFFTKKWWMEKIPAFTNLAAILYYIPCCWVLIWYQGGVVLS